MSRPDYLMLCAGENVPPRIVGFPHRLALLPEGVTAPDLGTVSHQACAIFMMDPGCVAGVLNDPSFDEYLKRRVPVLIYAARPRDLRPFLRRAEAFRRRAFTTETLP